MEIYPENIANNDCRICGTKNYWGRGDMETFFRYGFINEKTEFSLQNNERPTLGH